MPLEKKIRLANCGQTLAKVGAAALGQRLFVLGAQVVIGPVAAGEADDRAFGGQVAALRKLKQRRHQLAMRQVAGRSEQHDRARVGDARPRQCLAQRDWSRQAGFDSGIGMTLDKIGRHRRRRPPGNSGWLKTRRRGNPTGRQLQQPVSQEQSD